MHTILLWQGNSGGREGNIQPHYDGRLLPGLHQLAGEGLSAISVKRNHRHCKFTTDAQSRRSLVTCNQTIDKRNSFWDLLKPDLRKIKGLECSTSGSVAELFKAHNVENAGKPTYRKKMLRLLGSLVVKKSKTSEAGSDILLQNRHWTERQSVLAALVHEKEMYSPKIVSLHSDFSSTQLENNQFRVKKESTVDSDTVDTLFMSQPQEVNILTNSSYNALGELKRDTGFSDDGIFSCPFPTPLNETSGLDTSRAPCISGVPSRLGLENRQHLQQHIVTDCHTEKKCVERDSNSDKNTFGNNEDEFILTTNELERTKKVNKTNNYAMDDTIVINQGASHPPASSSAVINTSYTSSFCAREEEFTNYQSLTKNSSEVEEHFFEEIRTSAKLRIDRSSSTEFITNSEERLNEMEDIRIDTQVYNHTEDNKETFVFHSSDSGIDLDRLDIKYKNYPSFNLIDLNEDSIQMNQNDTRTEIPLDCNAMDSENLIEFDNIFYNDKIVRPISLLKLENNVKEDYEVFPGESCSNEYWNEINNNNEQQSCISGFENTFNINNANATSGYCIWGESNDAGSRNGLSANYLENLMFSNTTSALIPCKFIEDVWKSYYEAIYEQEAFYGQFDECEQSNDCQIPSYIYWANTYNQEVYKEAENLMHSIENFIVNECAPVREREYSNPYLDSCTLHEVQDDIFPLSNHISTDINLYASEESNVSRNLANTININDGDNGNRTLPNEEISVSLNDSLYSQSDKRNSSRNYIFDNSGNVEVENVDENTPIREIENPDNLGTRLVQESENINHLDNENIQMIFTSPNIQINLTNPIVNENRK